MIGHGICEGFIPRRNGNGIFTLLGKFKRKAGHCRILPVRGKLLAVEFGGYIDRIAVFIPRGHKKGLFGAFYNGAVGQSICDGYTRLALSRRGKGRHDAYNQQRRR